MKQVLLEVIESNDTSDHPQLAALYDEDGFLELGCWVTVTFGSTDYGVPGSPVWTEVDTVEVDEVEINAEMFSMETIEERWGNEVAHLVHASCMDAADRYDW